MMLQVLFDHLFCHLAYCRTEIPSRPKMPSPVPLLQMRKFFKQIAPCSPFYPPHDLARSHLRRTTHQNMHTILAYYSLYNSDFKCFARLTNQLSNSFCYLSLQNLISILRYPYKMILNLINRMTFISIIHATPLLCGIFSQLKLTG